MPDREPHGDPVDPQDPHRRDGAEDDASPADAELASLEAELAPVLAPEHAALPPARPPFRAALRAAFVSGRFEGDGAPSASLARALDAIVPPPPREEHRASVRAAFLAGAAAAPAAAPASAAPLRGPRAEVARGTRATDARGSDARTSGPRASGRASEPRAPWLTPGLRSVLVAAALLAVALGALWLRGRGPAAADWQAAPGTVLAGLRLDGTPVADVAALAAGLRRGGTLETGAQPLRLAVSADLVLELGPETRATVPAYASDSDLAFDLTRGALRIATDAPPADTARGDSGGRNARRLLVRTAHVEALVTGTVFGVDCTADYSCVCCLEGAVLTRGRIAGVGEAEVGAGRTRFIRAEGEVMDLELIPDHRGPLAALREVRAA